MIKSEVGIEFGAISRDSILNSGTLFGVYFPKSRVVSINFYCSSASNFGVSPIMTIPEAYRPSSRKEGSGMIRQSNGNVLIGNVRMNSDGTVQNVATTDCVAIFGIITYQL